MYSFTHASSFNVFTGVIEISSPTTHDSDDAKEKQTVHTVEVLIGPSIQLKPRCLALSLSSNGESVDLGYESDCLGVL